eukprot:9375638-Lingulodinium_polyedra.AAC.1
MRLNGRPHWQRNRLNKSWTHRYTSARAGIQAVEALGQSIHEGSCARNNRTHGPNNPLCGGMVELTATM